MQHPPATPLLPDSAGAWKHLLTSLRLDDADLLRKLLQTAVILVVAWLAMRLLRGLARRIERAAHDHDPTRVSDAERRGRTLAGLMQSIGTAVIAIVALLTVLDLFVNVAPLLAGLGVVASDTGVVLRLWVDVYPGTQSDAEREVRRRIKNRFDREGIEISVPRVVNEPGA